MSSNTKPRKDRRKQTQRQHTEFFRETSSSDASQLIFNIISQCFVHSSKYQSKGTCVIKLWNLKKVLSNFVNMMNRHNYVFEMKRTDNSRTTLNINEIWFNLASEDNPMRLFSRIWILEKWHQWRNIRCYQILERTTKCGFNTFNRSALYSVITWWRISHCFHWPRSDHMYQMLINSIRLLTWVTKDSSKTPGLKSTSICSQSGVSFRDNPIRWWSLQRKHGVRVREYT